MAAISKKLPVRYEIVSIVIKEIQNTIQIQVKSIGCLFKCPNKKLKKDSMPYDPIFGKLR